MIRPLPETFLRDIEARFPPEFLTRDRADLQEYGKDWTKVYAPAPSAVAFPRSTDEVARLLRLCNQHRVPIVPSGGRTGLAGGAVAREGELVLSLARMTRMDPVDLLGNTVRVQAGAVTEAVHQHCAEHGLIWPVDFASKGSSQVGGNISTNAGGVKVIRYGSTRQWVLGLQVVTAQGEVLELNGALEKNNTGVDLRQLFIGSEGTLGVITEATLKLTPLPRRLDVFLFAVPDGISGVLRLFREVRRAPFLLSAYEFFTDICYSHVERHRMLRLPFERRYDCYVLLEVENADPDALEAWVGSLLERGFVLDGSRAQGIQQARDVWALREGIGEALAASFAHKNDIALPIAKLEAFCSELDQVFSARYPGWEVCVFGHIGDGNLHVNALKPAEMPKEEFLRHTHSADQTLFELVRRHSGSISAEHGIGLLKKDFLHYSRSPAELAVLRTLKQALDPNGILNPGKIFD
jgi:FAD/FMN-containing dehydrogenase